MRMAVWLAIQRAMSRAIPGATETGKLRQEQVVGMGNKMTVEFNLADNPVCEVHDAVRPKLVANPYVGDYSRWLMVCSVCGRQLMPAVVAERRRGAEV